MAQLEAFGRQLRDAEHEIATMSQRVPSVRMRGAIRKQVEVLLGECEVFCMTLHDVQKLVNEPVAEHSYRTD